MLKDIQTSAKTSSSKTNLEHKNSTASDTYSGLKHFFHYVHGPPPLTSSAMGIDESIVSFSIRFTSKETRCPICSAMAKTKKEMIRMRRTRIKTAKINT